MQTSEEQSEQRGRDSQTNHQSVGEIHFGPGSRNNRVVLQIHGSGGTESAGNQRTEGSDAVVACRRDRIAIPSRATLLAKSRNIHQESEDLFERAVDVQLGIQRVPQLVSAEHLRHIAAGGMTAERPLTEPLVDYLLRVERLLLVGAPGAGKSATLRSIWRELLARAQSDQNLPVPFLLNLSTFSRYRGSFRDWLAESLRECAGMPLAIGHELLQRGQLFLLLDGLDEMAETRRAAALTELDGLLTSVDPALARCVVCSRTLEYEKTGVVLHLPAALELQPLTVAQVHEAVAKAGPSVKPLSTTLEQDPGLADLLATPLLLSIAARTFAGNSDLVLSGQSSVEVRQALFDAYIAQMLRRSGIRNAKSTLHCLQWLAHYMTDEQTTLFLMERLQPSLLRSKRLYRLATRLVGGLFFGLLYGWYYGLSFGLGIWLLSVLIVRVSVKWVTDRIQPVEQMRWSWSNMRSTGLRHLLSPLVRGTGVGMLFGVPGGFFVNRYLALLFVLVFVLVFLLQSLFTNGWAKSLREQTIRPNEGLLSSIRNGVKEGMSTWLAVLLFFCLVSGLVTCLVGGLLDQLGTGMVVGLAGGLFFGIS